MTTLPRQESSCNAHYRLIADETPGNGLDQALNIMGLEPSHLLLLAGVAALVAFILGMTVGVSL